MDIEPQLERRVLTVLVCVVIMAVLSGTMVNVALPIVGAHFDVSEGTYGWLVTGHALTFGLFAAIHGRLADNIGARTLYLFGLSTYALTALIIGSCSSIEWMILLRVVQGAGAAAMPAIGSLIISRTFPPSRRGWAMGVILGAVGFAASIGPFIGGFFVEFISWRAVFWFPGVSLVIVPFALKYLPKELNETNPKPMDWIGALLMAGAVTSFLWLPQSLSQQGQGLPTLVVLFTGLFCLIGFILRIQFAEVPFVPIHLFKIKVYAGSLVIAFLSQATRFGTLVLIPILLIDIHNLRPTMVGLALCPGAIAIAFLSPKMGALSDRIGPRMPVTIGLVAMMFGNIITIAGCGVSTVLVTIGVTLYGIGFAGIQSPLLNGVSIVVPKHHLGVGIGLFMTIFFLGGAFGVALSVTSVEWQVASAASWLPMDLGSGGRYSNAMLCLTGLGISGLILTPMLSPPPQNG